MFGSFLVSNESPRFLPRHKSANPSRMPTVRRIRQCFFWGEPTWKPYLKMRITGIDRITVLQNPGTDQPSNHTQIWVPELLTPNRIETRKARDSLDSDGFHWFPIPGTPQNYAIRRGATAALWFGRLRCLWHLGHRATEPGPHGQRFEPPVAPWSRCFLCVLIVFFDITTVWLTVFWKLMIFLHLFQ